MQLPVKLHQVDLIPIVPSCPKNKPKGQLVPEQWSIKCHLKTFLGRIIHWDNSQKEFISAPAELFCSNTKKILQTLWEKNGAAKMTFGLTALPLRSSAPPFPFLYLRVTLPPCPSSAKSSLLQPAPVLGSSSLRWPSTSVCPYSLQGSAKMASLTCSGTSL